MAMRGSSRSTLALALFILSVEMIMIPLAASFDLTLKPPEFLNECKRKTGLECGNVINIYLFGKGGTPYSDDCCSKLVEMGLECHQGVVAKHLVGKPQEYIDKIVKKSEWVWGHCVRVLKWRERHGRRL